METHKMLVFVNSQKNSQVAIFVYDSLYSEENFNLAKQTLSKSKLQD